MPKIFCLDQNLDNVISQIGIIRRNVSKGIIEARTYPHRRPQNIKSWFDFSTIDFVSPSAALLLAAEFDRGRLLAKKPSFAINVESWNSSVRAMLDQVGLFSILGIHKKNEILNDPKERHVILPFRSGDRVSGDEIDVITGELSQLIFELIDNSTSKDVAAENLEEKALQIYAILIEAIDNVRSHAYARHDNKMVVPRWWMTAAVDRLDKRLTVAVYDQGVSIPATLPSWGRYQQAAQMLRRLLGTNHDSSDYSHDPAAIAVAMKVARSSTGLDHRGRGLPLMAGFLDDCRDGRLRIISRGGVLTMEKGQRQRLSRLQKPLGGTLIEWEVAI